MLINKNGVKPKQNIIDNIYMTAKDAFDLGDIDTFRSNLEKGSTRRSVYNSFLDNGIDVGTFEDFEYNINKGMKESGMVQFYAGSSEFGEQNPPDYAPMPQTVLDPVFTKDLDSTYIDMLDSKGVSISLDTVVNDENNTFRDFLNDANANGALNEFITKIQADKLQKEDKFFQEQYANQVVDKLDEYKAQQNLAIKNQKKEKQEPINPTDVDVKGGTDLAFDFSKYKKRIEDRKAKQQEALEGEKTLAEIMLEREGYPITDELVEKKLKDNRKQASSFIYNGLNDIAFNGQLSDEQLEDFSNRIYDRTVSQHAYDFGASVLEGLTLDLYDVSKNAVESELKDLEERTGLLLTDNVREKVADIMAQEYEQSINAVNRFAGNMAGFMLPVAGSIKVTHGLVANLSKTVPKLAKVIESKGIGKVLTKNALESLPVDVISAHNRAVRDSERYGEDYDSLLTMYLAMDIGAGAVLGTSIEKFIDWKKLNPNLFQKMKDKIKSTGEADYSKLSQDLKNIVDQGDVNAPKPDDTGQLEKNLEGFKVEPDQTVKKQDLEKNNDNQPLDGEAQKSPLPDNEKPKGVDDLKQEDVSNIKEIDEGKPQETPEDVAPKESASVIGLNLDAIRNVTSKLPSNIKKYGTSSGNLPKSAYKLTTESESAIQSIIRDVKYESRRLKSAVKESLPKVDNQEVMNKIDKLLKGEIDPSELPESVADVVARMRSQIDVLSKRLIDEGVSQGDLSLKIDDSMGTYVTRSYRLFDEPDEWRIFIKNTPEGTTLFNKAVSFIRKQYPDKSDDQLQGLVNEILDKGDFNSVVKSGKLGSKDLSTFKKRKNVPPEIRALMGEYTDPLVNYSKSIIKMANLIERSKLLNKIYDDGIGKYLHKEPTGKHASKIAFDESKTMNPLNGIYTTPEIKEAIDTYYKQAGEPPTWLRSYMALNGAIKLGKTVFNPITHVRNFTGNSGFALMNGHVNPLKSKKAVTAIFGDLLSSNEKFQSAYKRYLKLDVVNEDSRFGELQDIIKDVTGSENGVEKFIDKSLAKFSRKTREAVGSVYQAEDDFWKIFAFENELDRYKKAFPEKNELDLEKEVSEIIRDTYPTYSKVPLGVKNLRRFPLIGGFVSFPAEVYRTTKNSILLAQKEMANKATRSIGIKRSAGIISALTATSYLAMQSKALLGIGDEEEKARRRFMPDWDKNGAILFLDDENYVNLSYTDPHSGIVDPIKLLMSSEKEIDDSLVDAFKESMSPFIGEEIGASAIREIMSNKKESGSKVYFENDPTEVKAEKIRDYFWNKARPGFLSTIERIVDPDDKYEIERELTSVSTGLRFSKQDYERSMSFKINRLKKDLIDAKSVYRSMKYYNPSEDELEEGFKNSKEALIRIANEAKKDFDSAVMLGVKREVLVKMLKEKRLDTTIRGIILGKYGIDKIDNEYIKGRVDKKSGRKLQKRPQRRRR